MKPLLQLKPMTDLPGRVPGVKTFCFPGSPVAHNQHQSIAIVPVSPVLYACCIFSLGDQNRLEPLPDLG